MQPTLILSADSEGLVQVAAERIADALAQAGETQKTVSIALAGGKTPQILYRKLTEKALAARIPWDRLHLFWGDERMVPRDHPDSNFRMVYEAMLKRVPLPVENIHPVPTGLPAEEAAQAYEKEIRSHFRGWRRVPQFDLILLGLGVDGHVASLFPWSPTLVESSRLAVTARSPSGSTRITLTLPVLNAARRVFFLVTGETKADVLQKVLETEGKLPAQRVEPLKGEVVWMADQQAASRLTRVKVHA
jgi:6-phosphogluconolactonase